MRILFFLLLFFCGLKLFAQKLKDTTVTKNTIDSINRLLDRSVVKKYTVVLKKYYSDDFFFKHATGKIDSRISWIKSVLRNNYASREHDSVIVELHGQVAIVTGTLNVRFPPQTRKAYAVSYIRVFAYRKKTWQLISHHSTGEWEIKNE
jgi:hypothetical protein